MTRFLLLLGVLAAVALPNIGPPVVAATTTCASFSSQAAAQAAYRNDPAGLAHLDADHDGIACEWNKGPYDRDPVVRSTTASAPRTQAPAPPEPTATPTFPNPPVTGDGSTVR